MVMAMANLAMATGNIGRAGVGVNPSEVRTTSKDLAIWGLFLMNCQAIVRLLTTRFDAVR